MSAELRVADLRKAFAGGRPAVDGVSFRVEPGEIVVLLGPSGCGKTTTLRSVAGLERPTSGTIEIGGRVVSDPERGIFVPPQHREVGMVFQSYAVWPHMTVFENVAYPLKHRRVGRQEIADRVARVLGIVGLSEYGRRPVVSLSGGQMQRVALARSLVYNPKILLLDEPLSNLDAKLRLRLRDDLRRIIKEAGVTALYVTHDQAEAVALADRVAVMRDGLLLQVARPADLYNAPVDPFVAGFTGATNMLVGRVAGAAGSAVRVSLDGGLELSASAPAGLTVGTAVQVAIRPENLRLAAGRQVPAPDGSGPDLPANVIRGRVDGVRYQGVQTVYEVSAGRCRLEVVELGSTPRYARGTEVSLYVPVEACWCFADGRGAAAQEAARTALEREGLG